jgi:hypothetical protein
LNLRLPLDSGLAGHVYRHVLLLSLVPLPFIAQLYSSVSTTSLMKLIVNINSTGRAMCLRDAHKDWRFHENVCLPRRILYIRKSLCFLFDNIICL